VQAESVGANPGSNGLWSCEPVEMLGAGQPRGENGRYISNALEAQLSRWDDEGGRDVVLGRVRDVEAKILAASDNPEALQSAVATLPAAIQLKAADVMRLTTAYGPNGRALKLEQFLDSLSPSEMETFEKWCVAYRAAIRTHF
jgi:hypothetical protein